MSNPSIPNTPPHLAQHYQQLFDLLAAQTELSMAVAKDDATHEEVEKAKARRDRSFALVFGLSVGEAFERAFSLSVDEAFDTAVTSSRDDMVATISQTGEGA